jgi:Subtilase family
MKVAVIDSGIHPGHTHVGAVAGGVGVTDSGFTGDIVDRIGHGTAVAGAIREKAPEAELYAVKVFDRRLSTNIERILRALEWCLDQRMDVINLSLGTTNQAHRERFERLVGSGAWVVSAADRLPGSLPSVIGVASEPGCPRQVFQYRDGIFYASPYPRSIPGVPAQGNLQGVSFAVANMSGFVARILGGCQRDSLRSRLMAGAESRL